MGSIADIETGELVDVNDVWLDVMGVTRAEVVGKTRQELGLGTSQGARDVRDSLRVRLETLCLITVPCEPPCEESDVGDKNPCLCGGD